ncbi:MAG: hypothetical protein ABI051_11415 [Vicinamibacterales bacterium]
MNRARWVAMTCGLAVCLLVTSSVSAQRGGGGGGGRGGGGGGVPFTSRTRLFVLTEAFTLGKDQKQQVKDVMDAAFKTAAPIRAELSKTRASLAATVIAGKSGGDLDDATKAYGAAASTMTGLEMKTLAAILNLVKAEQRTAGARTAFFLMRGAFAGEKKWDEVPEGRTY